MWGLFCCTRRQHGDVFNDCFYDPDLENIRRMCVEMRRVPARLGLPCE